VNFQGKPYPAKDVDVVRFMLFDSSGQLAELADAEHVRDGLWRATLSGKQTARLAPGSNRLEVLVTPRVVALPSFKTFWFVTVKDNVT
jgi:hypothetical protein